MMADKDFYQLLKALANVGQVTLADRMVQCQERLWQWQQIHLQQQQKQQRSRVDENVSSNRHDSNPRQVQNYNINSIRRSHKNPAVAYSILFKGYGQMGDLIRLEQTVQKYSRQIIIKHDNDDDDDGYKETTSNTHQPHGSPILLRIRHPPDVILCNSLMDAYINCQALDKAWTIFDFMQQQQQRQPSPPSLRPRSTNLSLTNTFMSPYENSTATSFLSNNSNTIHNDDHNDTFLNILSSCPISPNHRTYNTMLKGFAKLGSKNISQALSLANEMEQLGLWDDITTNTLVHATIQGNDLDLAERILDTYTTTSFHYSKSKTTTTTTEYYTSKHPNVEAYTELLDAYGKAGRLDKAVSVFQIMRQRGIEPNEITYTCIIGALARGQKIEQAYKLMMYLETSSSDGSYLSRTDLDLNDSLIYKINPPKVRLTAVMYNAFISSLLVEGDNGRQDNINDRVDEAVRLLRHMMVRGVDPNVVTISVLIEAFGRCHPPRVDDAKLLLQELGHFDNSTTGGGIFYSNRNPRIATSLIRTCGLGGDWKGAADVFRSIPQPDTAAVNAFLGACCRCNMLHIALQTFEFFFYPRLGKNETTNHASSPPPLLRPDVVTYSTLIGALLNSKAVTTECALTARRLYDEIKLQPKIHPDKTLIDIILKAMIGSDRTGLSKSDAEFLVTVLRDAECLQWEEGQLNRRKRAVRAFIMSRIRELGKEKEELWGVLNMNDLPRDENEDKLFLRKGWNKMDSRFRIFGDSIDENKNSNMKTKGKRTNTEADDFFESKGWNIFSSGFRII